MWQGLEIRKRWYYFYSSYPRSGEKNGNDSTVSTADTGREPGMLMLKWRPSTPNTSGSCWGWTWQGKRQIIQGSGYHLFILTHSVVKSLLWGELYLVTSKYPSLLMGQDGAYLTHLSWLNRQLQCLRRCQRLLKCTMIHSIVSFSVKLLVPCKLPEIFHSNLNIYNLLNFSVS